MPVNYRIMGHFIGTDLSAVVREQRTLESVFLLEIGMQIVIVVFGLHNRVIDVCSGNAQPADKVVVFGIKRRVFRIDRALRELLYLFLRGGLVFQIDNISVGSFIFAAVFAAHVRVQHSVLKIMRRDKHDRNNKHDKRDKENNFPDDLICAVSLAGNKSGYDTVPYALLFAFFLFISVTLRSKPHIHFCHYCSSFQSQTGAN